ncbi:hypothetical protein [Saccharothrix syringae]|uniref:Uncharacterized protein n=1 Tax=Saccharothrix syringae TaxID=103733 RepID=A0A5Q0GXK5_SACSY|nr:hypothetical protein [Saccharothrix syringae]QFZ18681.1 hypothetical protein EKG83_15485 [Saccharothrix syringae]
MSTNARRLRRTVVLSAAALAVAVPVLAGSAAAGSAAPACGLDTLDGTYLFAGDGWSVSGTGTVPLAFAGVERFDGDGGLAGTSSSSFNGAITSQHDFTGTYTVAADCTGTFTIDGTLHFDMYVERSGDGFVYLQTDPGSVSATTEHRATRQ